MTKAESVTEGIIQNQLLLAIGRLSMALCLPALGLFGWLAGGFLDGKFDAQTTALSNLSTRVASVEDQASIAAEKAETVRLKLAAMEAARDRGSKARDDDIAQILGEIRDLRAKADNSASMIAGLAAKVEILLQRDRAEAPTASPTTIARQP